jgi:methylisocitrate lyase
LSATDRFKALLRIEKPLQIVGVINAICALLAKKAGFKALYLSGAGVSNADFGLPDIGLTSVSEVAEQIRRIVAVTDLPLLVDADTCWGDEPVAVARAVRMIEQAGAAGLHLEDQVWPKRCGHLSGKRIIATELMVDKIKAALDSKKQAGFHIMIRTDALSVEGLVKTEDRLHAYIEAGAQSVFVEAVSTLEAYHALVKKISVPILANLTEFGKTPLFTVDEMSAIGVSMLLYPLSAFRAMNHAAQKTYEVIRQQGSQQSMLTEMQTRKSLYALLGYKER